MSSICKLTFTPVVPGQMFQMEMTTDRSPSIISIVDPNNFSSVNNIMSADIDLSVSPPVQNLMYQTLLTETQIIRVRGLTTTIPGAWSSILVIPKNTPVKEFIPYTVDIIPDYVTVTMNVRWQLINFDGNMFGPYIGNVENQQYVPPGDYTLNIIDLNNNILKTQEVSIDSNRTSTQIFIDTGVGTVQTNFNVPSGIDPLDFSYTLISDFGSSSMADNYDGQENQYDSGLYYIVVKYKNQILSAQNINTINFSVNITEDQKNILTVNIINNDNILQIESIS